MNYELCSACALALFFVENTKNYELIIVSLWRNANGITSGLRATYARAL